MRAITVGCAVGLVTLVAVFLWADRVWGTDHDLYGTAAEAKVLATVLAGLVAGVIGWPAARGSQLRGAA